MGSVVSCEDMESSPSLVFGANDTAATAPPRAVIRVRRDERGTRVAGRGHSVGARRRAHAQTRTETRAAAPCGPAIILRFRPAPGLLLHNHNRLLGGHSGSGEPFETSSPPSPAGAQGRPQCASRQTHSLPASTERNPLVFDAIVSVLPPRFPASTERNPCPKSPTVENSCE
jgi:hypothetical protein